LTIAAAEDWGGGELTEALPGSRDLSGRAANSLAGGATHDSWCLAPFAPAFERAEGAYKLDVDGRTYVDLWMGHGSLLLGHGDADVLAAAEAQLRRGTHLGGLTRLQVEWAEQIKQLVPSAELVRFTASGSEASHLAFRVARAFTGRPVIVRLGGHYHGWHECLLAGVADPGAIGQVDDLAVEVMAFDDSDGLDERLAARDVAAVLIEPGGGGSGALDWSVALLAELRRLCDKHATLLVFDEVISGFRYAPGGVQELSGVIPDLTMLAKVMAGGFPGGALVGKRAPMSVFQSAGAQRATKPRIIHAGTFNGFAVSAAAGIATLRKVAAGAAQRQAERAAGLLVEAVNASARAAGVDAGLFHNSSTIHLVLGWESAGIELSPSIDAFQLIAGQSRANTEFRRLLLLEGLDMHPTHGWVSAVHDEAALERAVIAFNGAFERLARSTTIASPTSCGERCHNPGCAIRRREFAGCDIPLPDRMG
jgi:glutamate-1-semialdehyde 2,1-aminomutase